MRRLFRRDEGDGQPRDVALLAAEAGPERGVEGARDLGLGGQRREVRLAPDPRLVQVMGEMRVNRRCSPARREVGEVSQWEIWGG